MRAAELREKPTSELVENVKSLEAELFNGKFQLATEQLTNSAKLVSARRDLARVKTVLRERALSGSTGPDAAPVDEEA